MESNFRAPSCIRGAAWQALPACELSSETNGASRRKAVWPGQARALPQLRRRRLLERRLNLPVTFERARRAQTPAPRT